MEKLITDKKEYQHQWYLRNKERLNAKGKQWYQDNKQHMKPLYKKYRRTHLAQIKERTKNIP